MPPGPRSRWISPASWSLASGGVLEGFGASFSGCSSLIVNTDGGIGAAVDGVPASPWFYVEGGAEVCLCDDGEACGAYISLDEPILLTVTSDRSGLDFTTDINIALPEASTSRFAGAELPLQRVVLKEIAK